MIEIEQTEANEDGAASGLSVPAGSGLSHKDAVRRMAAYARHRIGCTVVMAELATNNTETPDVLGFCTGGRSVLIEVKVSRSDFLADKNKSFRRQMERGMGDHRYFAAPRGLLKPEEMPEKWGLLEIDGRCVRERKEAEHQEANKRAEVTMLTSAIRRLELSTAVYVRADDDQNIQSEPTARTDARIHG
jgi:hypothetical protein